MPSKLRLFLPVVLAVLLALSAQNVFAEVLDQQNDPPPEEGHAPGSVPNSLFQSFKPSLSQLTSVDVRLENIAAGAREVTVRIRQGTPSGAVLAAQLVSVAGNTVFPGVLFHVTFASPVSVTPGSTYLIDVYWGATNSVGVYWMSPFADTYAKGTMFNEAGTPAGYDQNFNTWGSEVKVAGVGGVILPTNSLTVLSPYVAMIGLVATAAIALKKRRN